MCLSANPSRGISPHESLYLCNSYQVEISVNGQAIKSKKYSRLLPSEMEVLSFEPEQGIINQITLSMGDYG